MSTFTNDVVKIALSRAGYLPDHPYHLISNEEMADAFFTTSCLPNSTELDTSFVNDEDMFHTVYYLPEGWSSLQTEYDTLCRAIQHIVFTWKQLQNSSDSYEEITVDNISYHIDAEELPSWIYSYILNIVICENSSPIDIHDLLVLIDEDNIHDEFTVEAAVKCYQISQRWILKEPSNKRRPPSMFGEMHVIKSTRLQQQGS